MSISFSQPGQETNLADTTRPSSSSSSIAKENSLPSTSSRSLSPSLDIPTPPTPPVFSSPTQQSSRPPSSTRQCHKNLIFKMHHLQAKEEYIEFPHHRLPTRPLTPVQAPPVDARRFNILITNNVEWCSKILFIGCSLCHYMCVSLLLKNSFSDLPPQSKTNLCLRGILPFLKSLILLPCHLSWELPN